MPKWTDSPFLTASFEFLSHPVSTPYLSIGMHLAFLRYQLMLFFSNQSFATIISALLFLNSTEVIIPS